MNDSVLDILIFLFDNFMDVEDAPPPEQAVLRQALEEAYEERLLNPYIAADRGFIDAVIDPAETRAEVAAALVALEDKRERIQPRSHDNTPL
jgi:propionyl-CoA carboxylase beta chain